MNVWSRCCRHLVHDARTVRRRFPDELMSRIEQAVSDGERRHSAEIRIAIEASLPLRDLLRGRSTRQRALEVFAQLGVWDTEANNGVLLYLLLADHAVEIVADRAAHGAIDASVWREVCDTVAAACRDGRFEEGLLSGVVALNVSLAEAFPAREGDRDELPNRPAIL